MNHTISNLSLCIFASLLAISCSQRDATAHTTFGGKTYTPAMHQTFEEYNSLGKEARLRISQGDDKRAEALLKRQLELSPDTDFPLADLAKLYVRTHRDQDALEAFRTITTKRPNRGSSFETDPLVLVPYAELCVKHNLNDEAEALYQRALAAWHDKPKVFQPVLSSDSPVFPPLTGNFNNIRATANLFAGCTAMGCGRTEEALVLTRTALKVSPNWEAPKWYLAEFLVRAGQNREEAVGLYRQLTHSRDQRLRRYATDKVEADEAWKRQIHQPKPSDSSTVADKSDH